MGVKVIETEREVSLWKRPSGLDITSLAAASQGEMAQVKGKVSNGRARTMTGGKDTILKTLKNSQGIT